MPLKVKREVKFRKPSGVLLGHEWRFDMNDDTAQRVCATKSMRMRRDAILQCLRRKAGEKDVDAKKACAFSRPLILLLTPRLLRTILLPRLFDSIAILGYIRDLVG